LAGAEVSPRPGSQAETSVALYDHDLANYSAADRFRYEDAAGFVRIFGLGIETWVSNQRPAD